MSDLTTAGTGEDVTSAGQRSNRTHLTVRVLITLAALITYAILVSYDASLMRWRSGWFKPPLHHSWQQILEGFRDFGQTLPVIVVMIIVAAYDRRRRTVIVTTVLAVVLSQAVCKVGKYCIERKRPYVMSSDLAKITEDTSWQGWNPGRRTFDSRSFPSSHSASAFAFGVCLAFFYPRLRWLFWILAIGCATSRYLDTYHWPSDCFAGSVIGYLSAWLTTSRAKKGKPRG
jgi:membrane-associated phospholipid phosphatase